MPNNLGPLDPEVIAKSVHDSLESAINTLPADKDHAFFVDATYDKGLGARAGYVQRINGVWRLAGTGEWVGHQISGKVAVMGVW